MDPTTRLASAPTDAKIFSQPLLSSTAGAPALPTWGVYLHPSVFRAHATGKDIFLSLCLNGMLPPLQREWSKAQAERDNPKSRLSTTSNAEAVSFSVADTASFLPSLLQSHAEEGISPTRKPSDAQAQAQAQRPSKGDGTAAPPPTTPHVFLMASLNMTPHLVYFSYDMYPAAVSQSFSNDSGDGASMASEARTSYSKEASLIMQRLRDTHVNAYEVVFSRDDASLSSSSSSIATAAPPAAGPVPGLAAAAPLPSPSSSSLSPLLNEQRAASAERERASLFSELEQLLVDGTSEDGQPLAPTSCEEATRCNARSMARMVEDCLYSSRICASEQLHYCEANTARVLSGSVEGQLVGAGEGCNLESSPLLSGVDIALASMREGEEAVFFIGSTSAFAYSLPHLKPLVLDPTAARADAAGLWSRSNSESNSSEDDDTLTNPTRPCRRSSNTLLPHTHTAAAREGSGSAAHFNSLALMQFLMYHGSEHALCVVLHLHRRVPLLRVVPFSLSLRQCILTQPAASAVSGAEVTARSSLLPPILCRSQHQPPWQQHDNPAADSAVDWRQLFCILASRGNLSKGSGAFIATFAPRLIGPSTNPANLEAGAGAAAVEPCGKSSQLSFSSAPLFADANSDLLLAAEHLIQAALNQGKVRNAARVAQLTALFFMFPSDSAWMAAAHGGVRGSKAGPPSTSTSALATLLAPVPPPPSAFLSALAEVEVEGGAPGSALDAWAEQHVEQVFLPSLAKPPHPASAPLHAATLAPIAQGHLSAYDPLEQCFGKAMSLAEHAVGAIALPCWLDFALAATPARSHSLLYYYGTNQDERFMGSLLTEMRRVAVNAVERLGEAAAADVVEPSPTPDQASRRQPQSPSSPSPARGAGCAASSTTAGPSTGSTANSAVHADSSASFKYLSAAQDAEGVAAFRYAAQISLLPRRRQESLFCVQVDWASQASPASPCTSVTRESFYFVSPGASTAAVCGFLSEACALLHLYDTYRSEAAQHLAKSPSDQTTAPGDTANAVFAVAPMALSKDYMALQCGRLLHHNEDANAAALARFLPAASHNSKPATGNACVTLEELALTSIFLPAAPVLSLPLRMHCIHRRILFKALRRLYLCVFLLTFNVDEAAQRPISCGEAGCLYKHYFATTLASEGPKASAASPQWQRYCQLAECFHLVALIYAELDGLLGHGIDACTAALFYAPHEAALWMLRAVFHTRRRLYSAAQADLAVAAVLTETRLAALREAISARSVKPQVAVPRDTSCGFAAGIVPPLAGDSLEAELSVHERRLRDIHRQQKGVEELAEGESGLLATQKRMSSMNASTGLLHPTANGTVLY